MSTDHQITLTETDDGNWKAQEEPNGRTASGETPAAALDALIEADADAPLTEGVDPDALLFSGEPFIDTALGDETVDDVLYGSVEADNDDT